MEYLMNADLNYISEVVNDIKKTTDKILIKIDELNEASIRQDMRLKNAEENIIELKNKGERQLKNVGGIVAIITSIIAVLVASIGLYIRI